MDEESEEYAMYHAVLKHLKFVSSIFWSFPLTTFSKYFAGDTSDSTSKLEIYLTFFALSILLFLFYHAGDLLRRLFRRLFSHRIQKRLIFDSYDLLKERDTWELIKDDSCVYAMKGRRNRMEDRFSVMSDKETGIFLYGIFDGHGGEFAADFVEKHLFKELLKKLQTAVRSEKTEKNSLGPEFVKLLTKEILEVDLKLLIKVKASKDVAGTTALVAIIYKNELIVANVGDSRGVICDSKGNTIPLSFDHKPDQLKERRRIREAGGFISFNGVWRVAGILATSRALGDFPLKDRNLVIANPDILTFDLTTLNPQFMILATDGLWDTCSNEDAIAFVKDNIKNDRYKGAKNLALKAHKSGSMDNITVVVVDFSNREIS
ncbi:protein phosphatase 1L-like [Uloborus diversus]|uniref:protein phosphatase 1L-like n=1 Tax=Uloborus diversus TaxID=327109 RepID=UPI00240A3B3F|nr:protein phosphatase 1L-like [Uloborus diversus]